MAGGGMLWSGRVAVAARRGVAAMAALALAAPAVVAGAQEERPAEEQPGEERPFDLRFLGPFRTRDLTPTSLLRLDLPPAHGVRGPAGAWAVEVGYSHANTFVMSDTVRQYLTQRDRRAPLDEADVEALFARDGDVFYFDAEVGWIALTAHYGLTERWQLYATLPVQYYRGGLFDNAVEGFHEMFGFSTASRDLVSRHDVQVVQRVGEDRFVLLAPPEQLGIGDPVLGGRFHLLDRGRWHVVGEAALKVPLGEVDDYFSSGHADVGVQLSVQRELERNALYLSTSWIHVGGSDFFPHLDPGGIPTVSFAWEHLLSPRTSTVVQLTGSGSSFPATEVSELAENKYLVSVGFRRRNGHRVWSVALTENVANFNNSPDIGLHVGYALVMEGPRPRLFLGERPGPG
ncbi:MAG TPA: DUF3187 family protein [Thermoanaerobaculia bacterium]|nr:DUF3187 family protein [Thermoanaerobaculia bacterium]